MDRFDFSSFYGRSLVLMLGLTVFSCSGGGGCSSCEGCGVTPIAGGYPTGERIANSAQVRLTSSGIGFIEDNITAVVGTLLPDGLDFPIPRSEFSAAGTVTVCPDEDCVAHLEIRSLDLLPVAPNRLRAHIELYMQSRDTTGTPRGLPLDYWACNGNLNIDTAADGGDRDIIGVNADIVFASEDRAPRTGYTRLVVENVAIDPAQPIETSDLRVRDCLISGLINLFRPTLINQLTSQISDLANGAIAEQLCQTHGEYGCPDGTFSVPDSSPDAVCRFGPAESDECVPILLGMDGEGDLGGTLLGGFSPGTHAYAQFLLAAGGNHPTMGGAGEAVNGGMTIDFFGGFRGTDRTFNTTPAHHSCVPTIPPPDRPEIPQLAAFRGNVIPGTSTETHVGFGIAEAYMDYAGYGMFDSGMLCLGAGTRLSQQLSTGLVSALIRSLNELTFPQGSSPLTIAIRPQTPPDFTIGAGTEGDPLLQIALDQLQMDFYVWSTERYVRFMTFQTDLTIGIDLSVADNQLVPEIKYVNSTNSVVTNSELLSEQPTALASTLETVIGSFAGMLSSSISPFDLPDIMGFQLEVPAGGVTRVREGEHNFLGIFANLALASAPYTAPVETTLRVSDLTLDRRSMDPNTWNEGEGNHVWLHFGAEGPLAVQFEYSYRIDGGPWSAWTTEPRVRVEDDVLLLQARHEIEGRARVAGEHASTDESPARAELLIDILPPTVHVARTAGGVNVRANDIITASDMLEVRYQVDGEWTDWGHVFTLDVPHDDADVVVEVRDEAGNVGRSQSALIRGLPNANVEGCGCSAPGSSGGGTPLALVGLLGLFGLVVARRRGGPSLPFFLTVALGLFAAGCNCGNPVTPDPCGGECNAARPPGNTAGNICCPSSDMCVDYDLTALCEPGYQCAVADVVVDEMSCGVSCADCTARPALDPGILATHLDTVLDSAGTVYISGYSPGDPRGENLYGDLVFGVWDGAEVEWDIVDGAPSMPITNVPTGYRGGVSDPGDDVGRWTSIAMAGDTFLISYYDATNGALKLAVGGPGGWDTHTVDDQGDSGRYSSLVITPDGVPVIAYLRIEASTATPGQVDSSVMVATANIASPSGPTDWTVTQVATGPMACRPAFCESGATCLASGQCVTPTSDCAADCGSGNACFNGSCTETIPTGYVEDLPPALGLYTSLAVDPTGGLALVYYDRSAGNVHGARFDGATWGTPFLIDGYGAMEDFVGDCGMGADVAVDSAGLWHVAYIDGTEETLRYAQVQSNGTIVAPGPEVVDDGSTIDGATRHTDGRHIVGDDAPNVVLEGGGVRVAYQDSTIQNLVVAVRPPGGGAWGIRHIDEEGSTGYWVDQEVFGTTSYLTTWWRARDGRSTSNGIRVLMAE